MDQPDLLRLEQENKELREQVASLQRQLSAARQRLQSYEQQATREYRWNSDYLPYSEEDRD